MHCLSSSNKVDTQEKVFRSVEPATSKLGPQMRAMATLGAHQGTVMVAGGYTTLDKEEQLYESIRAYGDTWVCRLAVEDEDREAVDILSLQNPNRTAPTAIDIPALFQNAQRAVFHSTELRKVISELHPVGVRGAIIIPVMGPSEEGPQSCKLYSTEELYENMIFYETDAIMEYFHDLPSLDPDSVRIIMSYDPTVAAMVIYCTNLHYLSAASVLNNGTIPPFQLYLATFSRWTPDGVYVTSVNEGNDEFMLSQAMPKPVDATTLVKKISGTIEKCAYTHCKNLHLFLMDAAGAAAPPKLQSCSRCLIVKYCSKGSSKM